MGHERAHYGFKVNYFYEETNESVVSKRVFWLDGINLNIIGLIKSKVNIRSLIKVYFVDRRSILP